MSETMTKRSWAEVYGSGTATPQGVKDLVKLLWGTRTSLCLVGEAGIGKTQCLKQAAEEYRASKNIPKEEFGFLYVVLAHKDREHVTGLYYFSKDGKTFHSMHNAEVVEELSKPHGMYFVDEFNRPRDPSLLNAFFAMLSERGANGLYLKDGWTITSAINPASAEYMVAAVERDPAFRRRLCWVEMEFNRAEWMAWASRSPTIHKEVLRHLTDNPERVYDQTLQDTGKIGPTPAGWEDVSEVIIKNEALPQPYPSHVLETAMAGKIGAKDATDFIAGYTRQVPGEELPSALEIVSGYVKNEGLRPLIQKKLKKEGIGARSIEELRADGEDGGDNKGWLFKILEAVVLNAINTPLPLILEAAEIAITTKNDGGEEVEMSEEEMMETAIPVISKNLAMFLSDLPPELFATFTSLWGEVSKASSENSDRALQISMTFREYRDFVNTAETVRTNIRKTQGGSTSKSRRRAKR